MKLRYGLDLMLAFAKETGTEVRHEPIPCPGCKKPLEVTTGIHGETPAPGVYAICILCGAISQWLKNMTVRHVSKKEVKRMPWAARRELEFLQNFVKLKNENMRKGRSN